jgi:hypothetical protein
LNAAEQLESDPSPFEIEIAIANLGQYESPGNGKILAEVIELGGKKLLSEIHKLIRFGIRNYHLISGRCLLFTKKKSAINLNSSSSGISLLSQ